MTSCALSRESESLDGRWQDSPVPDLSVSDPISPRGELRGTVVSRFTNVANVRLRDGFCITLSTPAYAPASIRGRVSEADWLTLDPRVTDEVTISGRSVALECARKRRAGELHGETPHDRTLRSAELLNDPVVSLCGTLRGFEASWEAVLAELVESDPPGGRDGDQFEAESGAGAGAGYGFDSVLARRLRSLSQSLPGEKAIESLIGLGRGLTPSGDDIVCGYVAASCSVGELSGELAGRVKRRAWASTNAFSATILHAATEGKVAADLCAIIESFGDLPTEDAKARVVEYMEITGYSSGRDTLFGVLTAIRKGVGRNE